MAMLTSFIWRGLNFLVVVCRREEAGRVRFTLHNSQAASESAESEMTAAIDCCVSLFMQTIAPAAAMHALATTTYKRVTAVLHLCFIPEYIFTRHTLVLHARKYGLRFTIDGAPYILFAVSLYVHAVCACKFDLHRPCFRIPHSLELHACNTCYIDEDTNHLPSRTCNIHARLASAAGQHAHPHN